MSHLNTAYHLGTVQAQADFAKTANRGELLRTLAPFLSGGAAGGVSGALASDEGHRLRGGLTGAALGTLLGGAAGQSVGGASPAGQSLLGTLGGVTGGALGKSKNEDQSLGDLIQRRF